MTSSHKRHTKATLLEGPEKKSCDDKIASSSAASSSSQAAHPSKTSHNPPSGLTTFSMPNSPPPRNASSEAVSSLSKASTLSDVLRSLQQPQPSGSVGKGKTKRRAAPKATTNSNKILTTEISSTMHDTFDDEWRIDVWIEKNQPYVDMGVAGAEEQKPPKLTATAVTTPSSLDADDDLVVKLPSSSTTNNKPQDRTTAQTPCKLYLNGRCYKGASCNNGTHPPDLRRVLCKNFAAGRCSNGDHCSRRHEVPASLHSSSQVPSFRFDPTSKCILIINNQNVSQSIEVVAESLRQVG